MHINYTEDIRNEFKRLKAEGIHRGNTIEIQNANFRCDSPILFGKRNEEYIDAELKWYQSQSLNVFDLFRIYGKEVAIWKEICDSRGYINSNYGWCIYSKINGSQFDNVVETLERDPLSRQAVMIYTRPTMHTVAIKDGRKDFLCTTHCQYFINNNYLESNVYMRSNDAIFGFINDFAWQHHVAIQLADKLDAKLGPINWHAGSLHVYKRHWDLIQ